MLFIHLMYNIQSRTIPSFLHYRGLGWPMRNLCFIWVTSAHKDLELPVSTETLICHLPVWLLDFEWPPLHSPDPEVLTLTIHNITACTGLSDPSSLVNLNGIKPDWYNFHLDCWLTRPSRIFLRLTLASSTQPHTNSTTGTLHWWCITSQLNTTQHKCLQTTMLIPLNVAAIGQEFPFPLDIIFCNQSTSGSLKTKDQCKRILKINAREFCQYSSTKQSYSKYGIAHWKPETVAPHSSTLEMLSLSDKSTSQIMIDGILAKLCHKPKGPHNVIDKIPPPCTAYRTFHFCKASDNWALY